MTVSKGMIEGRYRALVTHERLADAGSAEPLRDCVRRLWMRSGGLDVNSSAMTGWRDDDACVERFEVHFNSSHWTGRQ